MSTEHEAIAAILGTDALNTPLPDGPEPRVVLIGPYDGGKSSAIRRLLAEDGTRIPAWLTVSAQPETFEENEITSGGLVYVDTPGLSGRSSEHGRLALNALASADLVMLVLGPQRTDDDLAQITAVAEMGFTSETVLVALARCESVGDPEYARDDFEASLETRKQALRKLLPEPMSQAEIMAIAADPFGNLAGQTPPGPEYYDPYRSWDGIAEIRAWLAALPGRLPELRAAAAERFRLAVLALARATAEEQRTQAKAVIEEAEGRRARATLLDQRLTELDNAAAEALRTVLSRELDTIVRMAVGMDSEQVRAKAETRLQAALATWEHAWNARLAELAQEAEQDLLLEQFRSSSITLDTWAAQLYADPDLAATALGQPSPETLERFSGPLAQITRGGVKLWLSPSEDIDVTLKAAKAISSERSALKIQHHEYVRDLTLFKVFGDVVQASGGNAIGLSDTEYVWARYQIDVNLQDELTELIGKSTFFNEFKEVDRAKRWLGNLDLINDLVPTAISLAGVLASVWSERRAENADSARRVRDQQKVAALTDQYLIQILGDPTSPAPGTWRTGVAKLRSFLAEDPALEPTVARAKIRIDTLDEAVRHLR